LIVDESKKNKNRDLIIALGLLFGVIALSILRQPLFFTSPRIWAEEGSVHIESVLNYGVLKSLFLPHLGYYSFFNNYVVGLGLLFFGIERIPYVTTLLSFLVILLVILAPLIIPGKLWNVPWKKVLLVFFSLTIGSAEIWVNTINSQFYFCLFSILLLLGNTNEVRGWKNFYVIFMMVNGALTGITTIVLLPFFLWKALKNKDRNKLDSAVLFLLLFGGCVQGAALAYLSFCEPLGRIDMRHISNLGIGVFRNISEFIPEMNPVLRRLVIVTTASLCVLGARKNCNYLKVIFVSFYLSFIFGFLSLEMSGGSRYGYAPAVLIFLFLLNGYASTRKILKSAFGVLIAILLVFSIREFFRTTGFYNPKWARYSLKNAYRNSYGELELKIFPQWENTNWVIRLPIGKYERFQ
jgi:hypothetical protein